MYAKEKENVKDWRQRGGINEQGIGEKEKVFKNPIN